MLGSKAHGQGELVFAGLLQDLVTGHHVLARVDRVLDLSWLRTEVRDCYIADGMGRHGIDRSRPSADDVSPGAAFSTNSCADADSG